MVGGVVVSVVSGSVPQSLLFCPQHLQSQLATRIVAGKRPAKKLHFTLSRSSHLRFSKVQTSPRQTSLHTMDVDLEANLEDAEKLKRGIAEFYDESSGIWEDIWGEHMHHGFYGPNSTVSLSDHRVAQIRMIEEALHFASVSEDLSMKPTSIVDVGCGIGGSSRYLARKYGAQCIGITLSPIQAQRAQSLAAAQGLQDKVSFQVADALNQPFPDGKFDLVWSMESGEHMPDKTKFVQELARVAAPGATLIIVTWCHRNLLSSEQSLLPAEQNLLKRICDAYYLPAWCSSDDYVRILQSLSLQDIKTADWSDYVAPFWPAVISSAMSWKGITSLLRSGWKTIRGALVMPLMIEGYKTGLIKFAIITCKKPS
ncbi:OLC1v1033471C1 [Oldenlandia corymbosa var. corymbosa]|uniref:OLC1v1033471C1 n=1 Tax=Oldenlandia corymbosa var. corymbosa TaxID=529605 RepID=A0AAV1CP55_OLDCO|nr:OLC1v1033471C1 [Oldenlandia corymbosa var. corymbosa]